MDETYYVNKILATILPMLHIYTRIKRNVGVVHNFYLLDGTLLDAITKHELKFCVVFHSFDSKTHIGWKWKCTERCRRIVLNIIVDNCCISSVVNIIDFEYDKVATISFTTKCLTPHHLQCPRHYRLQTSCYKVNPFATCVSVFSFL